MMALVVMVALLLSGFPPLTETQRVRLETATDGRDHREEAFVALLENISSWNGELGDAPIRLDPDLEALVEDPAAYRGSICRVTGTIQQRTRLAPPHERAEEWFIRDRSDRPIIVYMLDLPEAPLSGFRDGQVVSVDARFYKRVDFTARDGIPRSYPSFVGAFAHRAPTPAAAQGQLTIIAIPLALLLVAFLLLLWYTRRHRRGNDERVHRRPVPTEDLDDEPPLPEDPCEALAELKRRADAVGQTGE